MPGRAGRTARAEAGKIDAPRDLGCPNDNRGGAGAAKGPITLRFERLDWGQMRAEARKVKG